MVSFYIYKIKFYKIIYIISPSPSPFSTFLQTPETESDLLLVISKALKAAEPASVVITNKTAAGVYFKNLLSIKPIFSDKKQYLYVIGIIMDVTKELDGAESKRRLVRDLMDMLPSKIISNEEDEDEENHATAAMCGGCFSTSTYSSVYPS